MQHRHSPQTIALIDRVCSGKFGTAGPGGATAINVLNKYVNMAFHSDINGKNSSGGRAMWTVSNVCLGNGIAKAC